MYENQFIKPCPYATFIGCEKNCRDGCDKTNCEYEFANQALEKRVIDLMAQDSKTTGSLGAIGIEAELAILNSIDWRADISNTGKSIQFQDIKNLHGPLLPFALKKEATNMQYSERASEWGCVIARALAKIDFKKVGFFEEAKEAIIGTASHMLFNQQNTPAGVFVHNNTLLNIPGANIEKAIDRAEYCEKTVGLELDTHSILGHPDVLAFFPNDPDYALVSIDKKHARSQAYEKKSYLRQHIAYTLAVAQMMNLTPKNLIGVTIKRPFHDLPGERRKGKYHITVIKNDASNGLVKEFLERSKKSYLEQINVFHDLDFLLSIKDKKLNSKRGCINHQVIDGPRPCFNYEICAHLCKMCLYEKRPLVEILDELNAIPKNFDVPGC